MRRLPTPSTKRRAIHVAVCVVVLFGLSLVAWHPGVSPGLDSDHGIRVGQPTIAQVDHVHDTDRCPLCDAAAHGQAIVAGPLSPTSAPILTSSNVDLSRGIVAPDGNRPSLPRAPPQA